MKMLGTGSGYELVQDGERWLLVDRQIRGLVIAVFVIGLLTFIVGINGLVQLGLAAAGRGGLLVAGLVMLGVAGLVGTVLWMVVKKLRAAKQKPIEELPTIAVFDFSSGQLLTGDDQRIAPLEEVEVRRRLQLGSSSPALVAYYGPHSYQLAKGNPFLGGIAGLEGPLRAKGLMK